MYVHNNKMGLIKKHEHESGFFEENSLNSDATNRLNDKKRGQHSYHHYPTNGKSQLLRGSALNKYEGSHPKNVKNRKSSSSSTDGDFDCKLKQTKQQLDNQHLTSKYNSMKFNSSNKKPYPTGTIVIESEDEADKDSSDDNDHHSNTRSNANETAHESDETTINIDDEDEFNSNHANYSGELNDSFEVTEGDNSNHIEAISDDEADSMSSPPRTDNNRSYGSSGTQKKASEKSRTDSSAASQLILEIEEASTIRKQGTVHNCVNVRHCDATFRIAYCIVIRAVSHPLNRHILAESIDCISNHQIVLLNAIFCFIVFCH